MGHRQLVDETMENLRVKYHCTIDLLFGWFGLFCFANKSKNCQLPYSWLQTSQTGGQWYSDASPFSIPRWNYLPTHTVDKFWKSAIRWSKIWGGLFSSFQVASFETAEKEGEKLIRSCANAAQVIKKLLRFVAIENYFLFTKTTVTHWSKTFYSSSLALRSGKLECIWSIFNKEPTIREVITKLGKKNVTVSTTMNSI